MREQHKLPPEFERIAELAEYQPPEVQEVFQVMLAVAVEESGIAELTNPSQIDGRTWYSYESASGDVYSVVRPEIGPELEKEMREVLEVILEEELDQP
jgi:hypothetical protein